MKFVYPIEGKNAEELYKLNREGVGGFYPIGLYNSYHGGIHIEGNHAVIAIAEGTIIAYRYSKNYLKETLGSKTYKYSNSFILIRHSYTTPKGRQLTFYSHYYHLCPWEEYNDNQKKRRPDFFTKPGFCITASTLNVRSSMDSSKDDNKIEASKLKKGDEVIASAVDEKWAKKEGAEEYFVYKGFSVPITISSSPEFDSVVTCEIAIKAGALLGYTGLYEGEGIQEKYTAVHAEVFAGDDARKFVENKENEGQNKPTHLKIASQTTLKKRTKKYSDLTAIKRGSLNKDTTVKVLPNDQNSTYIRVQELYRIKDVDHAWLTNWTDPPGANNAYYNPKSENLANIQNVFNDTAISASTKLFSAGKAVDASNRRVRYDIPSSSAQTVWIKKASAGPIKDTLSTLNQDVTECYSDNPDTMIFNQDTQPIAEETLLQIDDLTTLVDEQKEKWYNLEINNIEGWIKEDKTNINPSKISAFDWPGFRIAKEEGDTAYDAVIDFKNLSPFFKRIVDEINTDSDKSTISKEEIRKALKDDKISFKLSRLICFHQSEWWTDSEMKYWDYVFKMVGIKSAENLKARLKNLCWWDEVSMKRKDFLPTPNVYHWHPVAFVENMKEMNKEPEWIAIAKKEIGQKEISGTKHNDRIVEYHKTTTLPESYYNDETAWCSSFVNWVMIQSGYKGTNSAKALSWAEWGKKFTKPAFGSIAVVKYDENRGHVGFVVGKDDKNRIVILGGNQGKKGEGSVNNKVFGTSKIIAYVLPEDFDFIEYNLPLFTENMEEGTLENTR